MLTRMPSSKVIFSHSCSKFLRWSLLDSQVYILTSWQKSSHESQGPCCKAFLKFVISCVTWKRTMPYSYFLRQPYTVMSGITAFLYTQPSRSKWFRLGQGFKVKTPGFIFSLCQRRSSWFNTVNIGLRIVLLKKTCTCLLQRLYNICTENLHCMAVCTYTVCNHKFTVSTFLPFAESTHTHTITHTHSHLGSRWRSVGRPKSRGQQVFCMVLPAKLH